MDIPTHITTNPNKYTHVTWKFLPEQNKESQTREKKNRFLKLIVHGKKNMSKWAEVEGLRLVQEDKEILMGSSKKQFGIAISDSRITKCEKFENIHN